MVEKKADIKISIMKALSAMALIFITIVVTGLEADPSITIYSGLLIGALNFIKHYGIQQGWLTG